MTSIRDEFFRTHDLYATGQEIEAVRDETGAFRAQPVAPKAEDIVGLRAPMRQGQSSYATGERDPSKIPGDIARTTGSLAKGAVAGAVGAPGDIAGLAYGVGRSIAAEEGERLDAFVSGAEELSAKYGAQAVSDILGNIGGLMGLNLAPEGDEQAAEMTQQAQLAGEVVGLPKGLQLAAKGARAVSRDVMRRQRGPASQRGSVGMQPDPVFDMISDEDYLFQQPEAVRRRFNEKDGLEFLKRYETVEKASENFEPGRDVTTMIKGKDLKKFFSEGPSVPGRKQDELGFYSRAQEFVDNLTQENLSGPQLKSQMLNAGVKADELKWTGLDEYLDANPKLTKQEAMDFIDQNKVRLEEITYQGGTLNPDTHQSFTGPDVIDDYEEINFHRERIDDEINSGDDDYLEQALENRGYNLTSGVAAYKELMQATGGRFLNVEPEVLAPIQAKHPDVDVKNIGWEVDAELTEIARGDYFNNPYYQIDGEGIYEDYRIVGNDDTGYYVTYQNQPVDQNAEAYSINEAQVQVQNDAMDRGLDTGAGETQYSEYTQEGAENYREVLLTNPGYKGDPSITFGEARSERLNELRQKDSEAILAELDDKPATPLTNAEKAELQNLKDQQVRFGRKQNDRFQGPHWQEDDVVAHARLSDRQAGRRTDTGRFVTTGGSIDAPPERRSLAPVGRVLYIEELQSDWAQQGRRRGFGMQDLEQAVEGANLRARKKSASSPTRSLGEYEVVYDYKRLDGNIQTRIADLITNEQSFKTMEDAQRAVEREKALGSRGVGTPEGPLVGKTDKWTEMAMRRLIRKAADEGYDFIAWTPGDVQFDRWNEEGLETYYNNVLPKATANVAKKLDKEAKVKPIEISIDGEPQETLALPITDKLKKMAKEGQPLFAVPAAAGVGAAMKPKEEDNGDI